MKKIEKQLSKLEQKARKEKRDLGYVSGKTKGAYDVALMRKYTNYVK